MAILLPFSRLVAPKQRPGSRHGALPWWTALGLALLLLSGCIDRRTVIQLAPAPPPVQVISPDPDIECTPRQHLDDDCVRKL